MSRLPQYVKLETALGSYSFPTQTVEIRNYIGDYLEGRRRTDLAEQFSLGRFSMNLQSLERTYIDKVFALCDYYLQGKSKRYSRHLYDIYKLTPLIEFNDGFAVLVREVREHRSKMQICLPCFFHQPYGFHFSLIPRLQGRFLPVVYEKSHNRFRVLELMQLETFGIVLYGVQIVKDVVIQSLYQRDTLDWSGEIFCCDIAELVIRNY